MPRPLTKIADLSDPDDGGKLSKIGITDRLKVWMLEGRDQPRNDSCERVVFVATLNDREVDWSGVVAHAVVEPGSGNWLCWIETIHNERRRGYGYELGCAMFDMIGTLTVSGVSPGGVALCRRLVETGRAVQRYEC